MSNPITYTTTTTAPQQWDNVQYVNAPAPTYTTSTAPTYTTTAANYTSTSIPTYSANTSDQVIYESGAVTTQAPIQYVQSPQVQYVQAPVTTTYVQQAPTYVLPTVQPQVVTVAAPAPVFTLPIVEPEEEIPTLVQEVNYKTYYDDHRDVRCTLI